MPRMFSYAVTIIVACAFTTSGLAQVDKSRSSVPRDSMISDQTLGISFLRIGTETIHGGNGYRMLLQSSEGTIRRATAGVKISSRRFVDLSGSYGGEVYLDDLKTRSLLKNRVKVDSINLGGLWYSREFWAVYAGMGAWEGVINCYAFHNRQYYVCSLNADLMIGKPGEVVDGGRMSAEVLRERVMDILNDSREPIIHKFNDFLSSVQVSN